MRKKKNQGYVPQDDLQYAPYDANESWQDQPYMQQDDGQGEYQPPQTQYYDDMYNAPPQQYVEVDAYGNPLYDDTQDGAYAPEYGEQPYFDEGFTQPIYDLPLDEEPPKPPKRTIFKPRTRRPSFILAVLVGSFRMLVLLVLILGLAGVGAVVGIAKAYVETSPVLNIAAIDDQAQTSFIYDADHNLITDYKATENRIMVSIDTMPLNLQHAFVAVEDARFYTHNGVDVKRILGAFVKNFVSGSQQGGSTITQQLIKNTVLTDEQSYKRKIQEAYLAMQLETQYSKDEILESYLNTIFLGENYYGVKVAANGYFGKQNLKDLTLRECAMLAGMATNPYYYNPQRNLYVRKTDTFDSVAITNDRTNYALRCMYESQFITREQYEAALDPSTARVLAQSPESTSLYKYPHYVEYAIRDVIQVFLKLNNLPNTSANRNKMENELRTGGYHVYLALDTQIQTIVEDTLYNYNDYPALRDSGDKIYNARNNDGTYTEIPQPQAAAVVLDYRTGEVKAIVGTRTRPTQKKTLNRATDMNMPVGSSIKPIAVYAPAIELGAGAGSVVYNMPLPLKGWIGSSGKDSWPQNYGGSSYRGPETFRTALTKSDNTAAAYALINYVGVDRSADFLLRMGVSEEHINRTPFGVSLGSSGISPLEMAVCFGVLGNGGVYQDPITFIGIADSNGNIIYDSHAQGNQARRQVFKASTAWLTIDMLKDVITSGTGTSAKISGQTVAGKTGTNSDQKGVFFAGLTGWYCATVWIGHDNYKALSSKTTGGNSAAKLWQSFMSKIHSQKGLSNRDILDGSASDYGLTRVTTCVVSGQLATDACRNDVMKYGTVTDYWPVGNAPTVSCQMHVARSVCAQSGMIATQYCPSVSTKGMVVIPVGHPLYQFIGTSYNGVLVDYLGQFSTTATCTLHYSGSSGGYQQQSSLMPNAQQLLSIAQNQLVGMDSSSGSYQNLANAINYLAMIMNTNPDDATLATAMANLTTAMAGN